MLKPPTSQTVFAATSCHRTASTGRSSGSLDAFSLHVHQNGAERAHGGGRQPTLTCRDWKNNFLADLG